MQGVYVLARLHYKRNGGLFAVIGFCFTFVLLSHMPGHLHHTGTLLSAWWLSHGEQTINCAPVVFPLRLLPYTET